MDDQRINERATLGSKNPAYCIYVQGVCRETVNRFCGQGHDFARLEQDASARKASVIIPKKGRQLFKCLHWA